MKRNEIESLLPEVFRRTLVQRPPRANVLHALLSVMEALHEPDEEALASLPLYLNPFEAPDEFVAFLARWLDLDRFLSETEASPLVSGLGQLRQLIAAAPQLSKWRGTAYGLTLFLEMATGVPGFVLQETVSDAEGRPLPFHVRLFAPAAAREYHNLIQQILELEKPAYVTYDLKFIE
jgi:phage tail-like protein